MAAPRLNDVLRIRDVNSPAEWGNVTRIPEIAEQAFAQELGIEFDWFRTRERGEPRTYGEVMRLAGLHETAWSLAQLFYDQTQKHSAQMQERTNLAHPAFGVAQLATQLRHTSAELRPIISGRGPTLFHGLSSARHLELLSTQRFKSGVQALHFRRKAG